MASAEQDLCPGHARVARGRVGGGPITAAIGEDARRWGFCPSEGALAWALVSVRAGFLILVPTLACAVGEPSTSSDAGFGPGGGILGGSTTSAGEDAGPGSSGEVDSTAAGSTVVESSGMTGMTGVTGMTGMTGTLSSSGVVESSSSGDTGGDCAGGCDAPGACQVGPGACVAGECVHSPAGAEVVCDDGDPCSEDDACDGAGGCHGVAMVCERPHAGGGVCQGGVCQGFECVAPWADCDGNMDNGCEVPVGIANQCDANGLNADGGCWTAYCGNSADPKAKNFVDLGFFCYDCANCHAPAVGQWQWCNHTTGNWYASAAGFCGNSEDLTCGPP